MTPSIAAYLAGLIDGEGTISISRHRTRKSRFGFNVQPYIEIAMTSRPLMEWVRQHVGEHSFSIYRKRNPMHRDAYCLMITGMVHLDEFLTELVPYLVLKQQQAFIMLEYCRSRLAKKYTNHGLSPGYSDYEAELFWRIRHLNQTGTHGLPKAGRPEKQKAA